MSRPEQCSRTIVCLGLVLACGSLHAQTSPPFGSPAWFAQKNPALSGAGAPIPSANAPYAGIGAAITPDQARSLAQQSITNLSETARRIAAAQAAQSAAMQLGTTNATVPNGLAPGGLVVDAGAATDPSLLQYANQPEQTVDNGRTLVTVQQTDQHAILTWQSFNIGPQTTLHFDQTDGLRTDGTNNWIVLNRVNDPTAAPSRIFGQIQAEGSVYLINRHGVRSEERRG